MRLFIGVWLSPSMLEEVCGFVNSVAKNYTGYKWTSPENLHFTLKFLGEVSGGQLPALKNSLRTVSRESFSIKLGSIGYFPSPTRPRIIWIGLETGQAELISLASSVEASCQKAGFSKPDKPFQPHLTIARAREDSLAPRLSNAAPIFKTETKVAKFSLIESQLLPKGPVYKSIEDFNLV